MGPLFGFQLVAVIARLAARVFSSWCATSSVEEVRRHLNLKGVYPGHEAVFLPLHVPMYGP